MTNGIPKVDGGECANGIDLYQQSNLDVIVESKSKAMEITRASSDVLDEKNSMNDMEPHDENGSGRMRNMCVLSSGGSMRLRHCESLTNTDESVSIRWRQWQQQQQQQHCEHEQQNQHHGSSISAGGECAGSGVTTFVVADSANSDGGTGTGIGTGAVPKKLGGDDDDDDDDDDDSDCDGELAEKEQPPPSPAVCYASHAYPPRQQPQQNDNQHQRSGSLPPQRTDSSPLLTSSVAMKAKTNATRFSTGMIDRRVIAHFIGHGGSKTVSFGLISVRKYPIILGDHPDCSFGPPVTIGWAYRQFQPIRLDEYEARRTSHKKNSQELIMSYVRRREILTKESGHTEEELRDAACEVRKIKRRRERTVKNLRFQKVEEVVQLAFRGLRKLTLSSCSGGGGKCSRSKECHRTERVRPGNGEREGNKEMDPPCEKDKGATKNSSSSRGESSSSSSSTLMTTSSTSTAGRDKVDGGKGIECCGVEEGVRRICVHRDSLTLTRKADNAADD